MQVHVRELEEELEDYLVQDKESSMVSGVENLEEYCKEDNESDEDLDNEDNKEWRKHMEVQEIIKEIHGDIDLERERHEVHGLNSYR